MFESWSGRHLINNLGVSESPNFESVPNLFLFFDVLFMSAFTRSGHSHIA
jgi:hypothetical protein